MFGGLATLVSVGLGVVMVHSAVEHLRKTAL